MPALPCPERIRTDRAPTRLLRETEDALVAFMEQQAKRDALYLESREELKEK